MSQPDEAPGAAVSEILPEPDWLAAEPTARAKLAAIMAAVRRCHSQCGCPLDETAPDGPHLTTTMAELFIGQLMMTAESVAVIANAHRAEGLRQFAADLDADAAATATLSDVGEKPWPSMLGARVDDAQTAVAILRRDAQLARNRADAPPVRPNVPAMAACPPVAVAGAPDPAESHP